MLEKNGITREIFDDIKINLPNKEMIKNNPELYLKPCLISDYASYSENEGVLKTKDGKYGAWMTGDSYSYCGSHFQEPREGLVAYIPKSSKKMIEGSVDMHSDKCGIRPVISMTNFDLSPYAKRNSDGKLEIEFGEYPQKRVDRDLEKILSSAELKKTGKQFRYYFCSYIDGFVLDTADEYEYQGKKYVSREHAWFEVQPVKWLLDEKNNKLVCKNVIVHGVAPFKWMVRFRSTFKQDLLLNEKQFVKLKENRQFFEFIIEKLEKTPSKSKPAVLSMLDTHVFDYTDKGNIVEADFFAMHCGDIDIEHVKGVRNFFYDISELMGKRFDYVWEHFNVRSSDELLKKRKIIEQLKEEKSKDGIVLSKKIK